MIQSSVDIKSPSDTVYKQHISKGSLRDAEQTIGCYWNKEAMISIFLLTLVKAGHIIKTDTTVMLSK